MRVTFEPVDLRQVVAAAVESVRPAVAQKTLELHVQADEEGSVVLGDAARLQQVIWNLLSNAIKFTPENGSIALRLERIGTRARIVVRDTGQGIAPELLPHVFEPFRQADTSMAGASDGLGLGLAVVRHLVEAHRRSVAAESEGRGCGATFTVSLPVS